MVIVIYMSFPSLNHYFSGSSDLNSHEMDILLRSVVKGH